MDCLKKHLHLWFIFRCWFELDPVFCTADVATVLSVHACVCTTLHSAALILELLTVLY